MSLDWDLETKEGWREYVKSTPLQAPERWTRERYDGEPAAARADYDERRRRHHAGFGPVVHERAQAVLKDMRRQLSLNRYAAQRPLVALVLDGDSTLGKSTLLGMLGWLYENEYGSDPSAVAPGNDYCPVVNISLEADASVVSINESVLRFLGAPLPPRGRQRDLNEPVKAAVRAAGVKVICVDELNFLKKRYVRHQAANDHLKWLMNQLPVTFVFAGVDCASTTLMAAKQTSWRVKWFRVEPFTLADAAGQREWQNLLTSIERNLVLLETAPRMLSGSAAMRAYLHRRSQGSIGPLLDLCRGAAEEAMTSGRERIDIELLDGVDVVHGAAQAELGAEPQPSGARQPSRGRWPRAQNSRPAGARAV